MLSLLSRDATYFLFSNLFKDLSMQKQQKKEQRVVELKAEFYYLASLCSS